MTDSYLVKKGNFWTGLVSIFSIFGDSNTFETSKSGLVDDKLALQSDWKMIGDDIRESLKTNCKFTL